MIVSSKIVVFIYFLPLYFTTSRPECHYSTIHKFIYIQKLLTHKTLSGSTLNSDEEYVCSVVSRYKNLLKDPDSLVIRGDILFVEDLKNDKYVFFNSSANNSFGAKVTSLPMYKGYSYLGGYKDDVEDIDEDEKIDFLYASRIVAFWYFYTSVGTTLTEEDGYN